MPSLRVAGLLEIGYTISDETVHLMEDAQTGEHFLVYGTDNGLLIDIRHQGDALWMTQAQIGQLFGRDQSVISRHIANIIAECESAEESNMQKMHIAGAAKPVTLHNLDMVISVGYRVSSAQATIFRRWATGILKTWAYRHSRRTTFAKWMCLFPRIIFTKARSKS